MTKPVPGPHLPPAYGKPEMMAVKALAAGNASEGQQKLALRWIIETAAGAYDLSFRPDSARASDFAEGKRFVGLQLVKLVNMPGDAFDKPARTNERKRSR